MTTRCVRAYLATVLGTSLVVARTVDAQGSDTVRMPVRILAPVVTSAEALAEKLIDVGFAARREHSGAPPSQFFVRAQIERIGITDLSQLLRRVKGRGWGCAGGVVFVDGVLLASPIPEVATDTAKYVPTESRVRGSIPPVLAAPMPKANPLDQIAINSVDAIEIYTGPSEIPLEFKAAFRQARCAVIVWTR